MQKFRAGKRSTEYVGTISMVFTAFCTSKQYLRFCFYFYSCGSVCLRVSMDTCEYSAHRVQKLHWKLALQMVVNHLT